jgi:hypothetical protein
VGNVGRLVGLLVAGHVLAGCGSVSTSGAWQAHCPHGMYAARSLDEWFRTSWDVTQGHGGPHVEGYIYNNYWAGAEQMLVAVERLDGSSEAIGCLMVSVNHAQPQDHQPVDTQSRHGCCYGRIR